MNINYQFKKILVLLFLLVLTFTVYIIYGFDFTNITSSEIDRMILTKIRIPRGILGIFVGGGLAMCGSVLQGVFRNNLVEPYTLGISGGAAIGVAVAITFSLNNILGHISLILCGFLGALAVLFFIYFIAMRDKKVDVKSMLLIGVMISFIASAFLMLILSMSKKENLQGIIYWMMGSLGETDNILNLGIIFIVLSGFTLFYLIANGLNAIQYGYEKSITLGIDVALIVKIAIVVSSLITAAAVSVSGVIGFVGLVVPHILKKLIGRDFRSLIPASFLSGAIFLLLSDFVASKIIYPNELPVGVVTGLLGGLFFIYIFKREGKF